MKKQTAVEWLIEQLECKLESLPEPNLFDQAKEMEREYIMDAFIKGELNYLSKEIQTPKEYYTSTYE